MGEIGEEAADEKLPWMRGGRKKNMATKDLKIKRSCKKETTTTMERMRKSRLDREREISLGREGRRKEEEKTGLYDTKWRSIPTEISILWNRIL